MSPIKIVIDVQSSPPSNGLDDSFLLTTGIALLALATSFYFGWLQRKHARLSSKPYLTFQFGCIDEIVVVENAGIGPAIVRSYTAKFGEEDPIDLLSTNGIADFGALVFRGTSAPNGILATGIVDGSIIGVSKRSRTMWSELTIPDHTAGVLRANLANITLSIAYEDIYGGMHTAHHTGYQ